MSTTQELTTKPPRLKFIDMTRSIAIIMMLEGHFTGAALSWDYRKQEYLAYDIWHNIHGLTSPLFFSVTGLIFVYLLTARGGHGYFSNTRVKKGFRRVSTLLFWGYFIQFSMIAFSRDTYHGIEKAKKLNIGFFDGLGSWFHDIFIPLYPNSSGSKAWVFEYHFDWFYAFHVLQSIGFGILLLLLVYGVYYLIKKGPIYLYYLIAALVVFYFYAQLKAHIQWDEKLIEMGKITADQRRYWPHGAPAIIQNMFYGRFSDFSFLRYAGYTLMGGALGNLIRVYEQKTREWWFGASFIVVGILISSFIQSGLNQVDSWSESLGITNEGRWEMNATHFIRLGQVISLLGILMLIDAYFEIKAKLFLKVGQNTLPIYVVHVIILYGGIFGLGLKPYAFNENLGPWSSIAISVTAICCFVVMVKYIEPLEHIYFKVRNKIFFKKH